MTGGSSARRRRTGERSSAAGTEEHGSPREAAGGMGAGPALATLLLAGSVLSATLLAPGRRAEPGERPRARGRSGKRGPRVGLPRTSPRPRGAGLSAAPGPRWGGRQCRSLRELPPGGPARPAGLPTFSCGGPGLGA